MVEGDGSIRRLSPRSVAFPIREGGVEIHPAGHVHQVLARGRVIVVSLPLTDGTEGVIVVAKLMTMS